MRIALLLAASVLVAGCSQAVDGDADRTGPTSGLTLSVPPSSADAAPPKPSTVNPARPPTANAPIAEVVGWVQAGTPANPDGFHTATRDGTTKQLGGAIAFTAAGVNCMTDSRNDGALACLVELTNPSPPPAAVYGEWKPGWVDFPGPTMQVGSAHGDPGPFVAGAGPQLPDGQTLAFGDYRCRAEAAGVVCVNYAHQSATRIAPAGVEPFGCLQKVDAPSDVGQRFSC